MKCLFTYKWVKLPRVHIPTGKGLMGSFLRLVSRAAFRPGKARYCGYTNDVNAGSWVGGIVGLKSILGVKDRKQVLNVMERLVEMGFITCSLNTQTKKLTYTINDWIMECSGDTCPTGVIYTTEGYGSFAFRETSQKGLSDRDTALANLTHGLTSGATLYGETVITHSQDWRQPFKLCAVNRYSRLKALAHAGVGRKPKSGASLKSMRIPFRFISSPAPMAASYSTISIRRTLARWKPQPTPS